MKRMMLTCGLVAALALAIAGVAAAATGVFTPFGNATVNGDGSVTLVSDTSAADQFAGVDLAVPSGLTVNGLTGLAAQFNATDDGCAGGSPRYQLNIDGKNVFAYFG